MEPKDMALCFLKPILTFTVPYSLITPSFSVIQFNILPIHIYI